MTPSSSPVPAGALLQRLTRPSDLPDEIASMRSNIERLDGTDASFSATASQLLAKGNITPDAMTIWVRVGHMTTKAFREAQSIREDCRITYTAAQYVIEEAILKTSLSRLEGTDANAVSATREAKGIMLRIAPDLRPGILASSDTIDRFYHPLKVAAQVLYVPGSRDNFADNAPAFLKWAKDYDDMPALLTAALKANSLAPTALEGLLYQIKETEPALRCGVL